MISIIVPAYNEADAIGNVLDDLDNFLKKENLDYEIIVVDDGSTDKTAEIVNKKNVRLIQHPYNKGYGASLKTGARNAIGEILLFIDADGQHSAEDVLKLLEHSEEYEMVVGARTKKSKIPLIRKIGKVVLTKTANYLSDTKIPDLNSGFRAVKKDLVNEFMRILPNNFSFTTTLTLATIKSGYNIRYVPIESEERIGTSKISPLKDGFNFILLILRTIVLFDPLKVFLPVSSVLFALGFLYGLYYTIYYFNIPDGAVLLIVSSIVIFFFGILADQISFLRRDIK